MKKNPTAIALIESLENHIADLKEYFKAHAATGAPEKATGAPEKATSAPEKATGAPEKATGAPDASGEVVSAGEELQPDDWPEKELLKSKRK